MEVCLPFAAALLSSLTHGCIVVGAIQLIDRGGGYIHHIRPRLETQDQNMGTYDRTLRERREDPRTLPLPIPRRLALQ